MKKFVALLLVMLMVLALNTMAVAEGPDPDLVLSSSVQGANQDEQPINAKVNLNIISMGSSIYVDIIWDADGSLPELTYCYVWDHTQLCYVYEEDNEFNVNKIRFRVENYSDTPVKVILDFDKTCTWTDIDDIFEPTPASTTFVVTCTDLGFVYDEERSAPCSETDLEVSFIPSDINIGEFDGEGKAVLSPVVLGKVTITISKVS